MGIDITQEAAQQILDFARKKGIENPVVRLMFKKTRGCGEFAPDIRCGAGLIPDEDAVVSKYGLTMLCNVAKIPELDGVTVDRVNGVIVLRSETLNSCGCGQAVTPKDK